MGFPEYKKDLLCEDFDVYAILDRYFHSSESHVFAGSDPGTEARLKAEIVRVLSDKFTARVHPMQLVICGSAHLGFSPVPEKLGKPFDSRQSDIDIAVVSPDLFEAWWNELQGAGLDRALRDTVARDLFWGFINPANVRDATESGKRWWAAFGGLKTDRARGVRGRLYRTFWSMESYHRLAVAGGREELISQRDGQTGEARAVRGAKTKKS